MIQSMNNNITDTNILNRNIELKALREKLKQYFAKNSKYNLRQLSRILDKNDAYLQQYLYRGTPKFLPEEHRYKLSTTLQININDLTPIWLQKKINNYQNIIISNIEKKENVKAKSINFSKSLLNNLNIEKKDNIYFYQTVTINNKIVTTLIDINIKDFVDQSLYLLIDKNIFFLAEIKLHQFDNKKVIVRPFQQSFSSFHINKAQLNIYGKALWQGCEL